MSAVCMAHIFRVCTVEEAVSRKQLTRNTVAVPHRDPTRWQMDATCRVARIGSPRGK
jgi:hypothetical protein